MTILTPAPVVLDDPAAMDAATVGSKAAHLAQLRVAGFTVPDGIVLPSALSRQVRTAARACSTPVTPRTVA